MVIHAVQVPHCPLPDDIELVMFPNVSNVCGLICKTAAPSDALTPMPTLFGIRGTCRMSISTLRLRGGGGARRHIAEVAKVMSRWNSGAKLKRFVRVYHDAEYEDDEDDEEEEDDDDGGDDADSPAASDTILMLMMLMLKTPYVV